MKIASSTGIKEIGAPATVSSYISRVLDYAASATKDLEDISDAAVMAGCLDGETNTKLRRAINTANTLREQLRCAVQPLQSILASLRDCPYDDDPRRPVLYHEAYKRATETRSAAQAHIHAIEDARDAAKYSADTYSAGGITSAAMEAIARADNVHSHALLACQATRQLLLRRGELQPYKPRL